MTLHPDAKTFETLYDSGRPQLVWRTFLTDLETPVSAMLKLKDASPYHILFESVQGGERRGRYSIIALEPDLIWRFLSGKASIVDVASGKATEEKTGVFASLRRFIENARLDIPDELPPMSAGVFGYMTYDMARHMEKLPHGNPDTIGIPEAMYIRPRMVVIFDSVKDEAFIVCSVHPRPGVQAQEAYREAVRRADEIIEMLNLPLKRSIFDRYYASGEGMGLAFTSHVSRPEYAAVVLKAKEYIAAGDIFQVVPSRRLECGFELSPFALYRSLRHLNPSPYLFYVNFDDFALVGSSPEILVKVKGEEVTIRPIAGTRKRGATAEEDVRLEKELLGDEKERAEHLMLLDLGRNDVGRVARPHSVRVTEEMAVERYSHVMHLVSNVEGRLEKGKDALDALIAGFPAGTVSGAPKIRAMQIIDELEREARSFYAGTVGYFSANGDMDTCIALRTGLVKDGVLYVQAGGGVVADSDPEAEFKETENKAGALMQAANEANKFI